MPADRDFPSPQPKNGPRDVVRRALRWLCPAGGGYARSRQLFVRGMGLIYLFAIASWWVQAGALVGSGGLAPVGEFLERAAAHFEAQDQSRVWNLPTLLWIDSSDAFLHGLCAVGALLALLVIVGITPGPLLLALWAIYLSLATTGNVFMNFQWDILLLEAGVLAVLASPWTVGRMRWKKPPPLGLGARLALVLCWIAIAKLMFQSGWVKLSWATPDSPEWWPEHTALTFHYMTQPLPTWTAWWMHQLPECFHKVSLGPMYFIEIVLPLFVFLGVRLRLAAAVGFAGLMLGIVVTGNYTYFNWLTIVMCLPLVADRFWAMPRFPGRKRGAEEEAPGGEEPRGAKEKRGAMWITGLIVRAPVLLVLLILNLRVFFHDLHVVSQLPHLGNAALPQTHLEADLTPAWADELGAALAPLRLVSGYGLFRTMTTDRPEIILEGSADGREWREYDLRWKPDRLDARPRFVAPHQPRVAWQFWFAALERRFHPRSRNAGWFVPLVRGLLENDPAVLGFFNGNPFPEEPPRFLRARLYSYDFTTREERRRTGHWWKRELAGDYLPVVSREAFRVPGRGN